MDFIIKLKFVLFLFGIMNNENMSNLTEWKMQSQKNQDRNISEEIKSDFVW